MAVPDHSPKMRTTIEIAALRAPATRIGTWRGEGRIRVNVPSAAWSGSAKRAMPRRPFLPARRRSAPVRPQRSIRAACTSCLVKPASASICACSGPSTTPAEVSRKISAPVREIVSAISHRTCSGSGVCRLSTNSQVRSSVADTALAPAGCPPSAANGGQGDSSSFSATQIDHRPGRPWVACSSTCGRIPKALRTIRPMARGMVALGRKPGPKTPPPELKPSSWRTGPLTTIIGAGPLVDCQPPPRAARSRISASNAASTTGKYSGRQPAMAAFTAAR
jgi:hypothetical protein